MEKRVENFSIETSTELFIVNVGWVVSFIFDFPFSDWKRGSCVIF